MQGEGKMKFDFTPHDPIEREDGMWLHENNVVALMLLSFCVGAFLSGWTVYLLCRGF